MVTTDIVQLYIVFSGSALHDSITNIFASATSAPLKNHTNIHIRFSL